MQAVTIRAAALTDLSELTRLWYEKTVLHQQYDRRFSLASDAETQWTAAVVSWLQHPNCKMLAAEQDAQLLGYIVGWVKPAPPGLLPAQVGWVTDLVVDMHSHWGGVGRLLFESLREWFVGQNIENIVAQVPRREIVGQAFWRAHGAVEWVDLMWIK